MGSSVLCMYEQTVTENVPIMLSLYEFSLWLYAWECCSNSWSTTLVKTEISQQLLLWIGVRSPEGGSNSYVGPNFSCGTSM